jgi:hypothetical protein
MTNEYTLIYPDGGSAVIGIEYRLGVGELLVCGESETAYRIAKIQHQLTAQSFDRNVTHTTESIVFLEVSQ